MLGVPEWKWTDRGGKGRDYVCDRRANVLQWVKQKRVRALHTHDRVPVCDRVKHSQTDLFVTWQVGRCGFLHLISCSDIRNSEMLTLAHKRFSLWTGSGLVGLVGSLFGTVAVHKQDWWCEWYLFQQEVLLFLFPQVLVIPHWVWV